MTSLKEIRSNKKQFLDLLLLADPSEEMIDKYLADGKMFVLYEDDVLIGELVIDLSGEVKNLAIHPEWQGKGYGRLILERACDLCRGKYTELTVGTSENGVDFYKKCGFEPFYVIKDFFILNYAEPIFDNGVQCVDMTYLKKEL